MFFVYLDIKTVGTEGAEGAMAPPVFTEGPKFLKKQDLTGSETLKTIEKICEICLSRVQK